MEYALVLAGLGGLLAISSQTKKKVSGNEEGFDGLLPSTNTPNHNFQSDSDHYPLMATDAKNPLDLTERLDHDNKYGNRAGGESVYTDKFFNVNDPGNLTLHDNGTRPTGDYKTGENAGAKYTSLLGQSVDESYFQHQNMVPYFGGKMKQRKFDPKSFESLMDSKMGTGSQQIVKTEQSPLFKPEDNMNWSFGMPNQNDFMQSRVNPSLRMANVKPFQEETVAPGLGLGYTSQGAGGFNSGMMDREAWMPKSVDNLRVANKPKAGGAGLYGYEGPADSAIKTMGTAEHMGRMEKNRPEKTYEMGGNRLFTTTGLEKGQTLRSDIVPRNITRQSTGTEYVGVAKSQLSPGNESMDGEYMPSRRQDLGEVPTGVAGWTNAVGAENDYGVKSHKAYKNNRSAGASGEGYFGALSSAITAAVVPVLDAIRPSRKENTVGNLRVYGDAGSTVPQSYVLNPNDRAPTTLRETTGNSKFHMNINANQLGGAYKVTQHQVAYTERASQSDFYYAGGSSAAGDRRNMRAYDAEYRQRNNDVKSQTIDGRMQKGNMALLNNHMNISAYDRSPGLQQATVRAPVPNGNSGINKVTPSVDAVGYFSLQNNKVPAMPVDRNDPSMLTAQLKGNPYALRPFAS